VLIDLATLCTGTIFINFAWFTKALGSYVSLYYHRKALPEGILNFLCLLKRLVGEREDRVTFHETLIPKNLNDTMIGEEKKAITRMFSGQVR
jgi:hypothetical protein